MPLLFPGSMILAPGLDEVPGQRVQAGQLLRTRPAHKKMSGCALSAWLEQADGWRFVAFQPTLIP
jgi:hypothetical protein